MHFAMPIRRDIIMLKLRQKLQIKNFLEKNDPEKTRLLARFILGPELFPNASNNITNHIWSIPRKINKMNAFSS